MKKIIVLILTIAVLIATSSVVYGKDSKIHDGVYRGEKWGLDLGKPENNKIIIFPQDRAEPKVYGNGYVGRIEISEKEYEITLLGQ